MNNFRGVSGAVAQNSITREFQGRQFGVFLGVVQERNEDDKTIRCITAANPTQLTPPLYRCVPSSAIEFSLPQRGETVVFSYVEGDPAVGVFWGVVENAAQRPSEDQFMRIRVSDLTTDAGTIETRSEGSHSLSSGSEVRANGQGIMVIGGQDDNNNIMIVTGQ